MPVDPPLDPGGFDPGTGEDGAASPTALLPDWVLTRDGVEVDPVALGIFFGDLVAYSTQGDATLTFSGFGGAVGALPDYWLGHQVALYADWGSGWTLLFAGRVAGWGVVYDLQHGWGKAYTAKGPTYLSSRVPMTSWIDGGDLVVYNGDPADSAQYDASRAGRSVGRILREVLDGRTNAEGLIAYGIGGYAAGLSSAGTVGTGATATASPSAGSLTFTVTNGGSNYNSASPPRVILVGGNGTYSSASCTVNGFGVVTAVSATGMSGWTIAPEVWISPLPLVTLQDLAALTLIPPYPVYVQGERLFDAINGVLQQTTRNYFLQIAPDGTIRIRDLRLFTGPTNLALDSASDRVHLPGLSLSRSVEDCYQRVVVRGGPDVIAVEVGTRPPDGSSATDNGLVEDFAHNGLTTANAKLYWKLQVWKQRTESGRATFTSTISGGAVNTLSNTFKGYGYAPSTIYNLVFSGGGGTGAAGTMTTDSSGQYTSHSITSGGSGYSSAPTVTAPPPPIPNRDEGTCTCPSTTEVTVTSGDSKRTWPANYWDHSSTGRQGYLLLTYDVGTNIESKFSARIISHPALAAGGTCTLTIEGALPATTYNRYTIVGLAGGDSDVWRKYEVTNANYVGKLMKYFPRPVPRLFADGSSATMTSVPAGFVQYSSSGSKPFQEACIGIDVLPTQDGFRTQVPTVVPFGTTANLEIGGASTDGVPSNVGALLAVRRGQLQVVRPADSGSTPTYTGTSNSVEGLAETLTVTVPSWIDGNNSTNMTTFAQEVLDSVKDAVVEGSITLLRFHGPLLATFGQKVRLTSSYATPWTGLDLPVVEARLTWIRGSGHRYQTTLRVSNRRAALSAEQFVRPPVVGISLGAGLEGLNAGALGFAIAGTPGAAGLAGGSLPGAGFFTPQFGQSFTDTPGAAWSGGAAGLPPGVGMHGGFFTPGPGELFGGTPGVAPFGGPWGASGGFLEAAQAGMWGTAGDLLNNFVVNAGPGSDGDPFSAARFRRRMRNRAAGEALLRRILADGAGLGGGGGGGGGRPMGLGDL